MKNRISDYKEHRKMSKFFLACEFKPDGKFWSIIEPFAYDIKPAFIQGILGIISYEPLSYAVLEAEESPEPLVGYLVTITEQDTVELLDKIKGYWGEESFNTHNRRLIKAYTDINKCTKAWCYVLSNEVLEKFEKIEQVEWGMFSQDKKQLELLNKIMKTDEED